MPSPAIEGALQGFRSPSKQPRASPVPGFNAPPTALAGRTVGEHATEEAGSLTPLSLSPSMTPGSALTGGNPRYVPLSGKDAAPPAPRVPALDLRPQNLWQPRHQVTAIAATATEEATDGSMAAATDEPHLGLDSMKAPDDAVEAADQLERCLLDRAERFRSRIERRKSIPIPEHFDASPEATGPTSPIAIGYEPPAVAEVKQEGENHVPESPDELAEAISHPPRAPPWAVPNPLLLGQALAAPNPNPNPNPNLVWKALAELAAVRAAKAATIEQIRLEKSRTVSSRLDAAASCGGDAPAPAHPPVEAPTSTPTMGRPATQPLSAENPIQPRPEVCTYNCTHLKIL